MKRKLVFILAFVLILATAMPATVLAASKGSTLDKLKLKDVKKYDTALPTKGVKKTQKQINALLNKISYKPGGKGDTTYWYDLTFYREKSADVGSYSWADKSKTWYKYDSKKKLSYHYSEYTDLMYPANGVQCYLYNEDSKYGYNYNWIKGQTEGAYSKEKRSSGSSGSTAKISNYKLYSDEKILGDKCLVYSYDVKGSDYKSTNYSYISRKTGVELKYISVSSGGTYTCITFDSKKMSKAASFYKKPSKVKFTLQKAYEVDVAPKSLKQSYLKAS